MLPLRSGLVLLLVLFTVPSTFAQASRTVTRTFDLAGDGTVTLDTHKGRVEVETWDRERAHVEAHIEGDETASVQDTKIRFDASDDRLDIETDYDDVEEGRTFFGLFSFVSADRPETDYTLTIPQTADLVVDTYSASTAVSHLQGKMRFDGYSANLTVNRIAGPLHADTYSGRVEVGRADGALVADTYSGDVRADSLSGPVEFSTFSGAATFGFVALPDDCTFESYSGAVTVTLPNSTGAVVDTPEGALDSDLPVRTERAGDDRIRATIGEGGPLFRFDTYSGTLSVRSR